MENPKLSSEKFKILLLTCLSQEKRENICGRRCCIYCFSNYTESREAVCIPDASSADWKQRRIMWNTKPKERSLILGSKAMESADTWRRLFWCWEDSGQTNTRVKRNFYSPMWMTVFSYQCLFLGLFHKLCLRTLLQGFTFQLSLL